MNVSTKAGFPLRVLAMCSVLAGCATPKERVIVREVKVPIAVACAVTVPARPVYAADAVSLDGSIFDLVQALLVEREARKAREAELEAVAKACTEPP